MLSKVKFRDVENKLQEKGFDKIILMVDEVQVDRQLAKAISHACELTFTDIMFLLSPCLQEFSLQA